MKNDQTPQFLLCIGQTESVVATFFLKFSIWHISETHEVEIYYVKNRLQRLMQKAKAKSMSMKA